MKFKTKSMLAIAVLLGLSLGNVAWAADSDPATYGQVKDAVKGLTYDSTTKKIAFTTIGDATTQYLDLSSLGSVSLEYIDAKKGPGGMDGNASAEADASTAVGYRSLVSPGGDNSTALGNSAMVYAAKNSTAVGAFANISMDANNSTAIGYKTEVYAQDAVALGANAEVSCHNSVAIGANSYADEQNTVSVGSVSRSSSVPAFQRRIVNVADGVNDYDAVNMKQLQDVISGGTPLEYIDAKKRDAGTDGNAYAEAYASTAVGYRSLVSPGGDNSTALGNSAIINGAKNSTAVGAFATVTAGAAINSTALGYNSIVSAQDTVALGANAKATAANSVAIGANSYANASDTVSVGRSGTGEQRRIVNVAPGTDDTDAATYGQVKIAVNNLSFDSGTKKISFTTIGNDTAQYLDLSSLGGGSIVSGDKTLTAGKNIGFTEYVDPADSTTKYAVGLLDNISGITSAEIGTTAKNVHLTNAGMTVTDNSSGTKSAGVTAEKVYVSSDGTIYSELGKTELKVNKKTYINENGINANGQKITNVADGTTDTDAVNYGQIRGAFVDVSYSGNVLTLTQVNGGTKTVNISSGGEASELVHKGSDATAVMIGKNTEATGQDALAFGNSSKANASEAVAVGYKNTVTGEKSTAVGNNNTVSGARSGAFGDPNTIIGSGSYAFGNDNAISGNNTFVMGNNVTATSNNAVILGHGSADGGDNTVSVGSAALKRRIVNVANAAADTDAVNLGQVNALLGTSGTGAAFYALKDEVAGIHSKVERLGTRINKVGAGAAALAAMHPVYDEDSKITFSAGLGAYRNEKAAALGAFYRFSDRVFMNCGATVGNDNNMYNIGLNFALDRHVGAKLPSKAVMARELAILREKTAEQDAKIAKLTAMLQELLEKSVN